MSAGTVAGKPRPRARPRPGTAARGIRPGTAARLGAVVGAVAVASLALDRIFAGHLLAVLMTGAAAAAAAVSAALARARGTWAAPLSVLALAGYGTAAAAWTAHRADVPGPLPEVLAGAAAHALPRLLGAMLPVEPQPDTVLAPVAAAWLAALLGAEVLLRSGRVLLALAPAAALFAGGLYLVGPNAAPAWWHAAAFAALTAAALARRRWPVAAAAGLAAGALAAGALAPVLTARPADPRAHLDPPVVDSLDENPLARLSGWAMRPRQELFTVALSRPAGARMRLAVLVDYDGVGWRVDGRYRHAGRTLPLPTGSGGTPPVRQEVTVTGLAGRLLPALARPHHVTGARVAFDADSGTLLGAPLRPGARYAVTSVPPPPPGDALADAEAPHGPAVRRLLDLGADPPPALAALAERLGGEAVGAYARAAAVEEYLRTHYRLVADAPSGHAYPNLEFFLFGPAHAGGQRGTSEQFAAAYAVLARLLGLPARVVVGFRLPAAGGPVRAGDAVAWPEVLF
ncbi:MAG TPA: transglutaminaseTgpA domain-containing protein, partial [Pilimelia sp.]|nr:transglutaminaseTgpA domain-containing protein [Pilimelia sp.]